MQRGLISDVSPHVIGSGFGLFYFVSANGSQIMRGGGEVPGRN